MAVAADWNSWSSASGPLPPCLPPPQHLLAQGATGSDWSPSGYSEAQWAGPSGSNCPPHNSQQLLAQGAIGSDWTPSGYTEAQWVGPSGSNWQPHSSQQWLAQGAKGSDWIPSGWSEAQWVGPSGSNWQPHSSQQLLAQGATGSDWSSSGWSESQWVGPSGSNWQPHSSQQGLAEGSPIPAAPADHTPAAPADHTPHGYREDIPGNHRRTEHYRARETGGSTGDKPPRHGDRGGKTNPNVIWHCQWHKLKQKAEKSREQKDWDAVLEWEKQKPKAGSAAKRQQQ